MKLKNQRNICILIYKEYRKNIFEKSKFDCKNIFKIHILKLNKVNF